MSKLINMPHVTVEQVVRFRDEALRIERDLKAQVEDLKQLLNHGAMVSQHSRLAYTDPEAPNPQIENVIHPVSGFMAGRAFNDLCKMIGGNWPDAVIQQEAPNAYQFFMDLLAGKADPEHVEFGGLHQENADLRETLETERKLNGAFAHGYDKENVNLQVVHAANTELWELLEAKNQTEAVDTVKFLLKLANNNTTGPAVDFALNADEGLEFLRHWSEGNYDVLREEWPEAPEAVYPQ